MLEKCDNSCCDVIAKYAWSEKHVNKPNKRFRIRVHVCSWTHNMNNTRESCDGGARLQCCADSMQSSSCGCAGINRFNKFNEHTAAQVYMQLVAELHAHATAVQAFFKTQVSGKTPHILGSKQMHLVISIRKTWWSVYIHIKQKHHVWQISIHIDSTTVVTADCCKSVGNKRCTIQIKFREQDMETDRFLYNCWCAFKYGRKTDKTRKIQD